MSPLYPLRPFRGRRIADAIMWIRTMKRIGNIAAAHRYERMVLALIACIAFACGQPMDGSTGLGSQSLKVP